MIAYREKDSDETGPVRTHPYIDAENNESFKYYDFRANPELIRQKLEDFKPYDSHEAIQTFYRLLEWLNSEDSILESNDCAASLVKANISIESSSKKLESKGRLMIFYRYPKMNIYRDNTQMLLEATKHYLEHIDPDFHDGAIGLSFFETAFEEIGNAIGKELVIQFWAFGDTEEETYENLNRLFNNLLTALKGVSNEAMVAIRKQQSEQPS